MTCRLCKERGKKWEGDDPQCAFPSGEPSAGFDADNWQCATMNALRDIAEAGGHGDFHYRCDSAAGSISVIRFEHPEGHPTDPYGLPPAGYIVLSFYKNRGTTGQAIVMHDDHAPRPLTLYDAEGALKQRGVLK